uniref:HAUS augmin like complex subunit 8 n=1 Tax=Acanthochromis polyacanthus TaxID=80966 RepID=A0A3Q1G028_9TELE
MKFFAYQVLFTSASLMSVQAGYFDFILPAAITPLISGTCISLHPYKNQQSNSLTNESFAAPLRPASPKPSGVKPKVGTPPRRSTLNDVLCISASFLIAMTPRETEPSLLGKSILQSTFSDGHCFRPDFDISAIKGKNLLKPLKCWELVPNGIKRLIEMQTFLLTYLTAKMEHNTAKLKAEAEVKILQAMEEEKLLHHEVKEKKRQYLLAEKKRKINEALDLQIATLTPVAEAAKQFTNDYKSFATSVDTTRHELPVKNFYINGDRKEFLVKSAVYTITESAFSLFIPFFYSFSEVSTVRYGCFVITFKGQIALVHSVYCVFHFPSSFSELLELSSLVCRHTIHVQQATEEEQLGSSRTSELYCPKQ